MRVALVNEGTYPYVTGGVSTWCNQLVRGLSDVDWDLVAIVGTEPDRPAVELPDNVRSLAAVPVWGPVRPARDAPSAPRHACVAACSASHPPISWCFPRDCANSPTWLIRRGLIRRGRGRPA